MFDYIRLKFYYDICLKVFFIEFKNVYFMFFYFFRRRLNSSTVYLTV